MSVIVGFKPSESSLETGFSQYGSALFKVPDADILTSEPIRRRSRLSCNGVFQVDKSVSDPVDRNIDRSSVGRTQEKDGLKRVLFHPPLH